MCNLVIHFISTKLLKYFSTMFIWILAFVVWIHCCHGELSQYHYTMTSTVPGSLVGPPLLTVSKLECSAFCSSHKCVSFTFNAQTGECRMHRGHSQGSSSTVPDSVHYYLLDGPGIQPDGHCLRNADCATIPSAVCDGGLCRCPRDFLFVPTQGTCSSDCLSLHDAGLTSDGIYEIRPDGVTSVNVSCDMTEGGWTVFQQRYTGDVNFRTATWNQSAEGFGNPKGDHWLGLKYVNMLTWTANEILFEMKLVNNTLVYFHHTDFSVANSSSLFVMKVSREYKSNMYSPEEYESFYRHNGKPFSTMDQDNDENANKNCALDQGPWWHIGCSIFGNFNTDFNVMRISNVPPLKQRLYFKQCRIKIRRQ